MEDRFFNQGVTAPQVQEYLSGFWWTKIIQLNVLEGIAT